MDLVAKREELEHLRDQFQSQLNYVTGQIHLIDEIWVEDEKEPEEDADEQAPSDS